MQRDIGMRKATRHMQSRGFLMKNGNLLVNNTKPMPIADLRNGPEGIANADAPNPSAGAGALKSAYDYTYSNSNYCHPHSKHTRSKAGKGHKTQKTL